MSDASDARPERPADLPGDSDGPSPTAEDMAFLVAAEATAGEYGPSLESIPGVARGSGDAAVAAAERRAESTAVRNIGDDDDLPIPADTANLRSGPDLHPLCQPLLPLIGVWRGEGEWSYPTLDRPRHFGQRIVISHDGRPTLRYESVMWLLPEEGDNGSTAPEPGAREVGWFRPQPDGLVELIIAHSDGVVELYYGQAQTLTSWSLGTDAVVRTASAPTVTGATRLYGIVEGKLAYVEERATSEHELQPHTSALLTRTVG